MFVFEVIILNKRIHLKFSFYTDLSLSVTFGRPPKGNEKQSKNSDRMWKWER